MMNKNLIPLFHLFIVIIITMALVCCNGDSGNSKGSSPDVDSPTVPTDLQATAVSASQIDLSWTASSDDVSVTGYTIYRCEGDGCAATETIGSSNTNHYSDTQLNTETSYTYSIVAYDEENNLSDHSNPVTATTLVAASHGDPVLFFSDLLSGPNSGGNWDGDQQGFGAAITIWGENLGAARGDSYITVNDVNITQSVNYAEWGENLGPARGLDRITFWLDQTIPAGDGLITVNVNGKTSNGLAFDVNNDYTIFFISPDGDNTNTGEYASDEGGGDGPWKDIYMFNPGTDSVSPSTNPLGDGQYIVYVRDGTYQPNGAEDRLFYLRGPYGAPDKQKALVGYPAETATMDMSAGGGVGNARYTPYGRNSYLTYSKLNFLNGVGAIGSWGDWIRIIGCSFVDMRDPVRSGVVMVDNSRNIRIFGNLFRNCGDDSYKHNIYIKTHYYEINGGNDYPCEYVSLGWNEIDSPFADDDHGGAIFLSTQSSANAIGHNTNHIEIFNNYFHDGNMDFLYTSDRTNVDSVNVYNNIFMGGSSSIAGIVIQDESYDFIFSNNIFYQIGGDGSPMIRVNYDPDEDAGSNPLFMNNIFYALPGQTYVSNGSGYQTYTSKNDIYFDPDGSASLPSGDRISVTDPIEADPLFLLANPTSFEHFALQDGSPGIDNGSGEATSLATFDFIGVSRPKDGNDSNSAEFDIGAYEK